MQTLLAYERERDVAPDRVQAGVARLEQWYGALWGQGVVTDSDGTGSVGLRLWHRTDDPCRWPAWTPTGTGSVATLHVPFGYRHLVGGTPLEDAPAALARRLQDHPSEVTRLTAPFVLGLLDRRQATLELWTDGLGLGRIRRTGPP